MRLGDIQVTVVPDDQRRADLTTPADVLELLGSGDVIIRNGRGWVRASTWERIKDKFGTIAKSMRALQ